MTDKKIVSINPELFSFPNTRKRKKEPRVQNAIKMKQPTIKKNDTLRKKTILKMIRQHQENRHKDNFSVQEKSKQPPTTTLTRDFDLAKKFFDNMVVKSTPSHNYTVKNNIPNNLNYSDIDSNTIINDHITAPPVQLNNNEIQLNNNEICINTNANISAPKFGCLKNGNLPTYRDYLNRTRKNNNATIINSDDNNSNNSNNSNEIKPTSQTANEMVQIRDKLKNLKKKKKMYRKKTIRTTFKLGRSSIKPIVSVLVSNKTIRNRTVQQTQLLKQVPIIEIRSYLMKHGFVKVGTITPNDVLRKMYESALLICGDVHNHNKDNLMYNFLNNSSEH